MIKNINQLVEKDHGDDKSEKVNDLESRKDARADASHSLIFKNPELYVIE